MVLFGFIVQVIGFAISITIEDFSKSVIIHSEFVIPAANAIGAILALIALIKLDLKFLQTFVFFLQGIVMTLDGIIFLGVFLYSIGIVMLFCYQYLEKNIKLKLGIIFSIWFISLTALIRNHLLNFLMAVSYTFFLMFIYIYLYNIIKHSLLRLFPITALNLSSITLPEVGTVLDLNQFGLSERQILLVREFSKTRASYKELAEKVIISESTVKKEMIEIFRKLGVKNLTSLSFLLSQYKISE